MKIDNPFSSKHKSRYLNSEAISTSTGIFAIDSNWYLAQDAA